METTQMLQKNIENIQNDVREIHRKIDKTNKLLSDYEIQQLRSMRENDAKYLKVCEFEHYFRLENENYQTKKLEKLSKSAEILKNMLSILHTSSPLVISILAYLMLKS